MQHGIQQMCIHKTYAASHESRGFDEVPNLLMRSLSNLRHCIHIPPRTLVFLEDCRKPTLRLLSDVQARC